MFVEAIERAAQFTRPMHMISRAWGVEGVIPGAATLFFVNNEGWAVTCKHVAQHLAAAKSLAEKYRKFKTELAKIPPGRQNRHLVRALEQEAGYTKGSIFEVKNLLVDCVEGELSLEVREHPSADVALLKFSNFTGVRCSGFPVFAKDGSELKQGKFLCRLGFPFPEFTNFAYDAVKDEIQWTTTGRQATPRFPIEGMVTRHLGGQDGAIFGFEISTPGLRGQSGGPAFDFEGRVWGMQSATSHLDLDFDVDMEVTRARQKRRVQESPFLHVGLCVHVDVLKSFMRENGVAFSEG